MHHTFGALVQLLKHAAPCLAQQLLGCGSHAPRATQTASTKNTKPLSNANTAVVQRTHLKQTRLHGLAAAFLGVWLPVHMGWLLVSSVASLWRSSRASLQDYPALASRYLNRSSWNGMTYLEIELAPQVMCKERLGLRRAGVDTATSPLPAHSNCTLPAYSTASMLHSGHPGRMSCLTQQQQFRCMRLVPTEWCDAHHQHGFLLTHIAINHLGA